VSLVLAVVCFAISPHGARAQQQPGQEGVVSRDAIWTDSVKYGNLPIEVRALGTMLSPTSAELKVATKFASLVQVGQSATIDNGHWVTIAGTVSRIEPYPAGGTVAVTVNLKAAIPEFAGQAVDGIVRIRVLNDVVYVGRPILGKQDGAVTIFKLEQDGGHANRVAVKFGATSVNSIQVLGGLQPGDHIILSDMSKYDGYDRVRVE
jgi:hypothetical protein